MTILEYLSTYDHIFSTTTDTHASTFAIPYIWQCWLQGQKNAPTIVKACLKSVHNYHASRKIKTLNQDSVHNYITIPAFILDKHHKGIIPPAHFTDYIRVALLAKYGGTWIDATVYLSAAISPSIFEQDFFALKFPSWCQLTTLPMSKAVFENTKSSLHMRCFSNWFMHAKANNRLIMLLQLFLETYWSREDYLIDYFIFHIFSTYIILKDSICADIFQNMPEINNAHAHLLQQCLQQEYDENLYTQIKASSTIHKLFHSMEGSSSVKSFAKHLTTQT